MTYVSVSVHVDDILDEISDDDLINEIKRRGGSASMENIDGMISTRLDKIYHKQRLGDDYQQELSALIYEVIGRL